MKFRKFQYVKTYMFGCAELNFSDLQNGHLIGVYTYQELSLPIELPVRKDEKGNEYAVLYGVRIAA